MEISEKRMAQLHRLYSDGYPNPKESFNFALVTFTNERLSNRITSAMTFDEWLATDPAPSVDDLSEEDRLGYEACVADAPGVVATRCYFTERSKYAHSRQAYNRMAKAVIDAYVSK